MKPLLFGAICCVLALCLLQPNIDYAADTIWSPDNATASAMVTQGSGAVCAADTIWSPDNATASATVTQGSGAVCAAGTYKAPEFSCQCRLCANSRVSGGRYLLSMCNPVKRTVGVLRRLVRVRR